MAKRIQISKDEAKGIAERLLEGADIEVQTSLKRSFVLGTMSDIEVKKEALKLKYEAKLAELEYMKDDMVNKG